jgi:hypothetical protein
MKKLFALFACISSSYSQLNSNAEILKNDVTETYKMIKQLVIIIIILAFWKA